LAQVFGPSELLYSPLLRSSLPDRMGNQVSGLLQSGLGKSLEGVGVVATADNSDTKMEGRWDLNGDDMKRERVIYCWCNKQGIVSHHSLGFSFDGEDGTKVYLKAEILFSPIAGRPRQNELKLVFTGPKRHGQPLDMSHYRKPRNNGFVSDLCTVKTVCEERYAAFGNYGEISNNCQHYVDNVLTWIDEQLEKRFAAFRDFRVMYRLYDDGDLLQKILRRCEDNGTLNDFEKAFGKFNGKSFPPSPLRLLDILNRLLETWPDDEDPEVRQRLCKYMQDLEDDMERSSSASGSRSSFA